MYEQTGLLIKLSLLFTMIRRKKKIENVLSVAAGDKISCFFFIDVH